MNRASRPNNPGGYVASAVINGVLLWVMNQLPVWKPFFLLDSYAEVLWAINMSLIVQVVLNLVLVFFHPRFFHYLAQTVISMVSFISLLWIVRVFPLDFSSNPGAWLNLVIRIILIVGLVGTLIGGITHFVRFFQSLFRGEPRREGGEERDE